MIQRWSHVPVFPCVSRLSPGAGLLCLSSADNLQPAGLVRGDGLLLHRPAPAVREAGLSQRPPLPHLRPRGPGGAAGPGRRV